MFSGCGARFQEVTITAVSKWVDRYAWLGGVIGEMIDVGSFYVQLSALNKFKLHPNLLHILDRRDCRDEDEFELISNLMERFFSSCSGDVRSKLCEFWVWNCCGLMEQEEICLKMYVDDYEEDLLVNLVRTLNCRFNEPMGKEREVILGVWKTLLVESHLKEYLSNHKGEFKSIELILLHFIR